MNQGLTQWGGLSLVLGWGAILGLSLYCMPRIFGRFFRGQGHGWEKGFGLGLSIAKAIAENIRGT